MSQMQLDFDLRLATPQGRTVRIPSELVCMTREHHLDFLTRKYRGDWDKVVMMLEVGKQLDRYYRARGM